MKCYNCNNDVPDYQENCGSCGAVVKCCMNCVFYEESYGSGKCLKGKYESNPKAKTYCDEFHIK